MSDIERLELLTRQMHLEPAEDSCPAPLPNQTREAITVKAAQLPNGKTIRLLKTLLSSYCENNCRYCPFRSQRDIPRAAFTPDDFARLFMSLHQSGFVEGIFLSSSIFNGPVVAQDKLLATAQILRHRYRYRGYLHLKIMPGAQAAQVEEAMMLADRLSLNLEGPNSTALDLLAPQKDFQTDLIDPLQLIHKIRSEKDPDRAWNGKWPSSTTQFVVGAAGETDQDLLDRTEKLTRTAGISRAYFSSFTPIDNTPLDHLPAPHPKREFRLYQAFFLMRDYGFSSRDLAFDQKGNLFLDQDPKVAWAEKHLKHHPLEINSANKDLLLRVPGIGPSRAKAIHQLRTQGPIKSFDQLTRRKLLTPRGLPYVLVDGKSSPFQPKLF